MSIGAVDVSKDPRSVESGLRGARARWGPPRVLRLDTLDPVTRDIIRAILAAREDAAKLEPTGSGQS